MLFYYTHDFWYPKTSMYEVCYTVCNMYTEIHRCAWSCRMWWWMWNSASWELFFLKQVLTLVTNLRSENVVVVELIMSIPLSKPEKIIQNKTCFRFVLFIQAAEFRYAWPRIWISGYRMFFSKCWIHTASHLWNHLLCRYCSCFFQFNF